MKHGLWFMGEKKKIEVFIYGPLQAFVAATTYCGFCPTRSRSVFLDGRRNMDALCPAGTFGL
jgi:hypothetical protein